MVSKPKISKLLESSESEGEEGGGRNTLQLNNSYAERYEKWRGKEELQKLKDKGVGLLQEDSDSESSSESESEWNPEEEKQFFKTLSCLKKKDPKIYDGELSFFKKNAGEAEKGPPDAGPSISKREMKKPFLLKDHERKMVLESNGQFPSDDEAEADPGPRPDSYYDELKNIKRDISSAVQSIDSDGDDDNYGQSDLLKKRVKSKTEIKEEEEDYRKWLKGQVSKLDNKSGKEDEKEMKFLKDYWNDPKLDDGEQFLRDYILNRKYVEGDKEHIPSYDEIVHDSDEGGISGDERQVEEMEQFENKYNFRFEEPDQDFIKKYPRTVSDSLRRTEVKRKTEREHQKDRKKLEKEKKVAEIHRFKALKRKEILEKLEKLQEISGKASTDFSEADVEEDFDPLEHDRRMEQIFSDQYYGNENDAEKPEFPYDEDIDGDMEEFEDWAAVDEEEDDAESEAAVSSKSKKKKKRRANAEDYDTFDCDADAMDPEEGSHKNKKDGKPGKKNSIYMEALERDKPKFDPQTHSSFQEYFDEYYKLDFEDLVGDIPCRFKYRKVIPNDFGLTMEEILKAPDRELNQWASVKRACQYRSTEEEKYDVQAYQKKANDLKRKRKILLSLYSEPQEDDQAEDPEPKKSKRKKKKKKGASSTSTPAESKAMDSKPGAAGQEDTGPVKVPKKKKIKLDPELSDASRIKEIETKDTTTSPVSSKKKRQKSNNNPPPTDSDTIKRKRNSRGHSDVGNADGGGKKTWKGKTKNSKGQRAEKQTTSLTRDRLLAYGINPTKYEKRKKYKV